MSIDPINGICNECGNNTENNCHCGCERELTRLRSDLEICMAALDHLSSNKTVTAALFSNICEAGRNEIQARIEYADEKRKMTHEWKQAELECDNG